MEQKSTPPPREAQLRAAMMEIVAGHGLDRVTVREVAAAVGVSIGTVQHYFPTKAEMVAAAFDELVARVRDRLAAVPFGTDPRTDLRRVLAELLPLDDERAAEARVQLAFTAYAATTPALAASQAEVLDEVRGGLAQAFAGLGQPAGTARTSAVLALAAVDGLAQHAVSAPGSLTRADLETALDRLLGTLTA